VLNAAIQYVAALSVIVRPFMPTASDKIRTLLNLAPIKEEGELEDCLNKLAEGDLLIESGHKIGAADHLFTRISDEIIEAQIAKLKTTIEVENGGIEPFKDSVAFDDFVKMDLRTATIIAAQKVPKASKLLEIKINLGTEERTVVSGIAEHYKADEIIGKKVVLLANLAPRKIRGVESQGMILMAEGEDGKLGFVSPEDGWGDGMTIR
jgi:methionyl-tRNA synthetase